MCVSVWACCICVGLCLYEFHCAALLGGSASGQAKDRGYVDGSKTPLKQKPEPCITIYTRRERCACVTHSPIHTNQQTITRSHPQKVTNHAHPLAVRRFVLLPDFDGHFLCARPPLFSCVSRPRCNLTCGGTLRAGGTFFLRRNLTQCVGVCLRGATRGWRDHDGGRRLWAP